MVSKRCLSNMEKKHALKQLTYPDLTIKDLNKITFQLNKENQKLKAEFTEEIKFVDRKVENFVFTQRRQDKIIQEIKDKTE